MTEECYFKWSFEPLGIQLYMGSNISPLKSMVMVGPTSRMLKDKEISKMYTRGCNFTKVLSLDSDLKLGHLSLNTSLN